MSPMPYYVSPEQMMKDRADYARKGIGRGKSIVAVECAPGIVIIAENPSVTLHKIGELYDRIAFAGVGKYNEFESLRKAGIRLADLTGFSYAREDVTAKAVANAYAQVLGATFTEQMKPFEVEILVAQVGADAEADEMYRVHYDGTLQDEQGFVAMGGNPEPLLNAMRDGYHDGLTLDDALKLGVSALESSDPTRELKPAGLEVAILDRMRPKRAFRRLKADEVATLLA